MPPKRILITGAGGFVGKNLCSYLIQKGLAVTGSVTTFPAPAEQISGVHYVATGRLDAATDWQSLLKNCDIVIHLAARVHVMKESLSNPLAEYRRINVDVTRQLAREAAACGVRRFIYLSTIKVHGEGHAQPHLATCRETDPARPVDPYAISKYEAEQALALISEQTQLPITIVRPPLIYGPGVGGNFLSLMRWVVKGYPLPLSKINNQRSLVFVDNLCDALYKICLQDLRGNQLYLISDALNLSTTDLVTRMARAAGKLPRLFPLPRICLRIMAGLVGKTDAMYRLMDSLIADSSKARHELDWQPPFSTQEGLEKTLAWYKKYTTC